MALEFVSGDVTALENEELRSAWVKVLEGTTDQNGLCAHQAEEVRTLAEMQVIEVTSMILFYHEHGRMPKSFADLTAMLEQAGLDDLARKWHQHTEVTGRSFEEVATGLRFLASNIRDLADLYDVAAPTIRSMWQSAEIAHNLRKQAMQEKIDAVLNRTRIEHQMDPPRE